MLTPLQIVGQVLKWLVTIIGSSAIVVAVLFPLFATNCGPKYWKANIFHVKQVSIGVNLYSADYDDFLPATQTQELFRQALHTYVKSDDLLKVKDQKGSKYFVIWNISLVGVNSRDIVQPEEVVAITTPAFEDMISVGFVDGHTKRVSTQRFSTDYSAKSKGPFKLRPGMHIR